MGSKLLISSFSKKVLAERLWLSDLPQTFAAPPRSLRKASGFPTCPKHLRLRRAPCGKPLAFRLCPKHLRLRRQRHSLEDKTYLTESREAFRKDSAKPQSNVLLVWCSV